ncbi:keywimysin-related RiPP [Actinoplanes missouriensis]
MNKIAYTRPMLVKAGGFNKITAGISWGCRTEFLVKYRPKTGC